MSVDLPGHDPPDMEPVWITGILEKRVDGYFLAEHSFKDAHELWPREFKLCYPDIVAHEIVYETNFDYMIGQSVDLRVRRIEMPDLIYFSKAIHTPEPPF